MKVKELIKFLENCNPEMDVLLFTETDNVGLLDGIDSACFNGNAVQLNGDSTFDD